MESKIGIARAAADMIRDGQVVLINGGTTNLRIASCLSRDEDVLNPYRSQGIEITIM
jgi:DeoR/GlpR family transcriptional regulator of sugar metabolism